MIELKLEDIQRVEPLFDTIFGASWFVDQVKQGIGTIYIQDENVKTAVMMTPSSEHFFVGLYDEDFLKDALNHIQTNIIPHLEDHIGFFYYGSSLWHDGLIKLIEQPIDPEYGRYLTRQYYCLNLNRYEECKRQLRSLDDHYQIKIESDPYKVYFIYQQEIVGFAVNNGLSLGIMDIDVYTHGDHRKRGLALQASTKLIDHCLKQGWTPQWACWSVNLASIGLAIKLGFELVDSQSVIFVSYVRTVMGEIMEQSIIIPRKKSVSIHSSFWMLFSMAIFVLFLFMHYAKPIWFTSDVPGILVILSWIAIPILAYVFVYYFKNIFNPNPVLVVNETGILDQLHRHSIGMIQWRDIEDIKIQPYMDKHFYIHIFLINPDDYIQKKSLFRSKKQGHVVIPSIYFKKDFQKVIDIIHYHFEKTHNISSQWTDFMDEDNRHM